MTTELERAEREAERWADLRERYSFEAVWERAERVEAVLAAVIATLAMRNLTTPPEWGTSRRRTRALPEGRRFGETP
jgi:hypothetical protein